MDNTNNYDFKRRLVVKIRPIFELHVIPSNVLNVFHKYDTEVLTQGDIDYIRARSIASGNIDGANELLERLIKYNNWYKCLQSVLRDPGVKLRHVADAIQVEKELLDEFNSSVDEVQPTQESKAKQGNQTNVVKPSNDTLMPLNMSLNTLSLESDSPAVTKNMSRNTMSMSQNALEPDSPAETKSSDTNYIEPVDFYPPAGTYQNASPGNDVGDQKRAKIISEIPERNFELDEVNVLSSFPGWHADIEDRTVLELLKPHSKESGCYIIWYWSNKKRPAICVTHEDQVKTLLIHKRPDPADTKKAAFYFINKDERRNSLKEIVQHHITNGVYDLSRKPQKVKISFIKAL